MEYLVQLILIVIFIMLTYFQVFSQGFYSCVIMAGLTVVSAITAFNYYEPLAALMSDYGVSAVGPQSVAFLGLFAVTLFGLRQFSDRFIRGNMHFPQMIDRAGSTVFAGIASLIMVGMIAIGFQLMPVDAVIMGFDRCEQLDDPEMDKSLWIRADEFVLGMIKHSSRYCFANNNNFAQIYPNGFLREQYFNRITPNGFEGMRYEAAHNALLQTKDSFVYRLVDPQEVRIEIDGKRVEANENETYVLVTVEIDSGTEKRGREKGSVGARDKDGRIRMAYAHMKLVTYNPRNPDELAFSVYPLATKRTADGLNAPLNRKHMANLRSLPMTGVVLTEGDVSETGQNLTKTILFKLPGKLNKDNIMFLEFKRSSRADISVGKLFEGLFDTEDSTEE